MSVLCKGCRDEIHPQRIKALPNTRVCVKCSTEGTYKAITTVNGEGDHTWNDIQLITDEEYQILEKNNANSKPSKFDEWGDNEEDDGRNLHGPYTIIEEN
jgi:hypothetical protein